MKKNIFILTLLLILYSCNEDKGTYNKPNFKKESTAQFERLTEDLYYNVTHDIWEYKSYIIINAIDPNTDKTLHVYDKNTGELKYSGIHRGRGHKETLLGFRNVKFQDGIMTYYDMMKNSTLKFHIDSLMNKELLAIEESRWDQPKWADFVTHLDSTFLSVGCVGYSSPDTSNVSRMYLKDEYGQVIAEYDEFPLKDKQDRFTIYGMQNIRCSTSPDNSKLAIGVRIGATLETYNVKDTIAPINTKYFIKPEYEKNPARGLYTENSIAGFRDIYTTNDKIYSSYDGETVLYKYFDDDNIQKAPIFANIAIFDWEGTPLELIKTNTYIEKLCYSESENTIYAIFESQDGKMNIGKLKL